MSLRKTSSKVLRRTSSASGSQASLENGGHGGVAVVGVEEDTVGESLHAVGQVGDGRGRGFVLAGRHPHLDHLPAGVLLDQLAG